MYSQATDIIARMKEEMKGNDREIEELKELLKRNEGEVYTPRPMRVERGTSSARNSHGNLRALVREVVREELWGYWKGG